MKMLHASPGRLARYGLTEVARPVISDTPDSSVEAALEFSIQRCRDPSTRDPRLNHLSLAEMRSLLRSRWR